MAESLLASMPRGDPERTADRYQSPAAMFGNPVEMRQSHALRYQRGKLFFGVIDGKVTAGETEDFVLGGQAIGIMDPRHVMTIAGSRTGKGRSTLIPNLLQYPGSILATDPKAELASITARYRMTGMRQKVFVLDPFGEAWGKVAIDRRSGFNPIAAMRPGRLVEDAALIADALVMVSDKDPHWDESARAFIEGVILHLKTWPNFKGQGSLVTLRRLVGEGSNRPDGERSMAVLETDMRNNGEAKGVIKSAAADFFDKPPNERGSVLSSARRHLKFIDLFLESPEGMRTLEDHDFELDGLKREPMTIYLCLPGRHIGTCARWLRLFVNLALQAMERRHGAPAGGLPVLFALDEFAQLGHLRQVEDAAGQIAGFGVKLWPILQDLGQLKALYKERWETFMGNAGVLQFFGNNDLTTLKWIAERCGRTAVEVRRRNELTGQQLQGGASGESRSMETHELITVDEAARFFGRNDPMLRQLVLWAGRRPMVLQRAFYDKHSLFAGQFDRDKE